MVVMPDTEQTPALVASAANVTGRPELAVAPSVYGVPPTTAEAGGTELN